MEKKRLDGLGGLKKSQNWPQKEVFRVLTKIIFIHVFFFFSTKLEMGIKLFVKKKKNVWEKSSSGVTAQKHVD